MEGSYKFTALGAPRPKGWVHLVAPFIALGAASFALWAAPAWGGATIPAGAAAIFGACMFAGWPRPPRKEEVTVQATPDGKSLAIGADGSAWAAKPEDVSVRLEGNKILFDIARCLYAPSPASEHRRLEGVALAFAVDTADTCGAAEAVALAKALTASSPTPE